MKLTDTQYAPTLSERYHLDIPLFLLLFVLLMLGLFVMYSASGQDWQMMQKQGIRIALSLGIMLIIAQSSPYFWQRYALYGFGIGLLLLFAVLEWGEISKGAQRWLNLGFVRFQPSELMKLALPILLAQWIGNQSHPPQHRHVLLSLSLIGTVSVLIAQQPDLGTAILIASSGLFVLFLSGIRWRWITAAFVTLITFLPILWFYFMHAYQRRRVMTLFSPESDPLGAGYHIIQSKIAIGSGGLLGKGWLYGTQSQLEFLPERQTDFIFAVIAEELGLMGVIVLLTLYLLIVARGLWIAHCASTAFGRLLAGSLTLNFFIYIFVNIGMVSGLLPVVGVPLPLISYGGTSMVTLMIGFGLLMSIHTHKRLINKAT